MVDLFTEWHRTNLHRKVCQGRKPQPLPVFIRHTIRQNNKSFLLLSGVTNLTVAKSFKDRPDDEQGW